MNHRPDYRALAAFIAVLGLALALLIVCMGTSHAVMIEPPDRTVTRLEVRYAEPIPARGMLTRAYFELNDGSAWGYRGYGPCARAQRVPNRICRTVFWYAR